MEELLIKNVQAGIRAIRLGLKTPDKANVGPSLNRLKYINKPMYDDLMNDYKATLIEFNNKKK